MQKLEQKGRSMLEMLGVLAVVGVISAGGFKIFSQGQSTHKMAQLATDTVNFARMAKRMACQYDNGYTSYAQYMFKSNVYPNDWVYNTTTKKFTGQLGAIYNITGNRDALEITISNLSEEACMKVGTSDWGTRQSSGFIGIKINDSTTFTSRVDSTFIFVSENCEGDDNTILLKYSGC